MPRVTFTLGFQPLPFLNKAAFVLIFIRITKGILIDLMVGLSWLGLLAWLVGLA